MLSSDCPTRDGTMFTVVTGAHNLWCFFPMLEAAVVPPFGQWNAVVDCSSVNITGSMGRNALEVMAVLLAADGMIPLSTPRLSWSSERGGVAFLTGDKFRQTWPKVLPWIGPPFGVHAVIWHASSTVVL